MKVYRMKGIVVMLICFLLVASACSKDNSSDQDNAAAAKGLGPYGKFDSVVDLSIGRNNGTLADSRLPEGETFTNNLYVKHLLDKLNVKISYAFETQTDEAYQQKINLAITSRDLPDAFFVNELQLHQLVDANLIQDLTDIYDNTASPLLKEMYDSYDGRALNRATIDGKLYGLPGTNYGGQQTMMWIRQDWLDKLGLKIPRTLDELEKVAKAFIEQDPDGNGEADTLGLTGSTRLGGDWNGGMDFNPIFGVYKSFPRQWIKDKDGNIVYGGTQPETKAALGKLRDLYASGIIDKQFATREETEEVVASGKAGIISGPWWYGYWPLPDSIKLNPKAEWTPFTGITDSEGTINIFDQDPSSDEFLVVKKGYKYPDAVINVFNVFYDSVMFADPEAKDYYRGKNVQVWLSWPVGMVVGNNDTVFNEHTNLKTCWDAQDESKCSESTKPMYESMLKEKTNPKQDQNAWGEKKSRYEASALITDKSFKVTRNEFFGKTKTMIDKMEILNKLQDETFLNIVLGRQSLDSFDDFAKEWNKIGGAQILKEINESKNAK
ncbi:extracellular solute-binding protein [Paenibacillus sp. OV219]|uniref:extracellular solute-binding protein n=1 Tax=Paenibacillus sp. OV219 TaxID=1884377 RepID=UPI0008B8C002|nr:extracellular solute-binding protein [Paenibacillus sp. OV219]SEO62845.1 putative aldouronate transport system substrate-binding protein [Paenibacillus sp. OV219]